MCVFIQHEDLDMAREIFKAVVDEHKAHPEIREKMVDDTVAAVQKILNIQGGNKSGKNRP
ncbi:hypothetical protein D3C71_1812940 [compost metagenome]